MKKSIFLIALWIIGVRILYANNIEFITNAPDVVVCGEQFRLTFSVNSMSIKDFRAPSITNFDVLMGPSRSQHTSTQIINGNVSSSSSVTYTYVLVATKEGTFKIPGATIKVDGKEYRSNAVVVKVLPPDKQVSNNNINNGQGSRGTKKGISNSDLFMTATVNKSKVHEQEAILLTYKIYTVLNLTELQGKMPDLKGFHTQEVNLPRNKTYSLERYNGRNYRTIVWSQYVLFPQQTGKLEIPSISFTGVIEQPNQNINPLDAFFNGGSAYISVQKQIVTPKVVVDVQPLPDTNKPASFVGAVGDFSLTSSINSKKIKTGDALTLKLVLSGTGNMKLISTPEVKFPSDFETYDPKIENNFSLNKSGLSGNKVFEFLAIPRHPGKYTIPSIEISYFDLKSNSYKTLKTEAYEIEVEKGKGDASQVLADFTNKEDVKHIGKDILYIKLGDVSLKNKNVFFFGSVGYYIWYIIPLLLFVVLVLVYRKHLIENNNIAKVRTKKANKVAKKRMKLAEQLLKQGNKNEFYDEVLKTLWGYISDKLGIPVSQLSKENIKDELVKHNITENTISEFINILDECEFVRYAPSNEDEMMDKIYASTLEIISKIEDSFKC